MAFLTPTENKTIENDSAC
uniref:Uncharacterized protein n=1 Tax=Anguilla anguilla TaxID=7936 RepID=A0A0E9QDW7_ANGAN